jgi:hypothetical protein
MGGTVLALDNILSASSFFVGSKYSCTPFCSAFVPNCGKRLPTFRWERYWRLVPDLDEHQLEHEVHEANKKIPSALEALASIITKYQKRINERTAQQKGIPPQRRLASQ